MNPGNYLNPYEKKSTAESNWVISKGNICAHFFSFLPLAYSYIKHCVDGAL
jgi:hypothetical protein